MAEPLRLRILKALTAELEKVVPTEGGVTDLSGRVFRGRDEFGNGDPIPMLSLLESVDEKFIDGTSAKMIRGSSERQNSWELLLQGWVDDDPDHPTDPAHYLMADVMQRLAAIRLAKNNILGFGGLITELDFTPGIVRPPDTISDKAYFWVKLRINVVEDHSDPYA